MLYIFICYWRYSPFPEKSLVKTLTVKTMSSVVLPRDKSARGISKPWMIGPAQVKPANCSRDL